MDHQRRRGLESGIGRHRTGPQLQDRGRAAAGADTVARHAQLARIGDVAQHPHIRAVRIDVRRDTVVLMMVVVPVFMLVTG
jgi:hypothetical protein